MDSAPLLRVRLFGQLDLRLGSRALPPLGSARAGSLLAYLLLHRDAPQPRQHVAFLLWPDSTERQARTNLRHVLHNLRRALPDLESFLHVSPTTLQWRADAPFQLDVAEFESLLARSRREDGDGGLTLLRDAVELYTGDLLENCYDEWITEERDGLRRSCLHALERLAELSAERGDPRAISYAERLLRHDPLAESAYRLLMRLHHARGDRARALRVYDACTATLERELGTAPSAPTRALYEALLPPRGEDAPGPHAETSDPALVGRTAEWERLLAVWRASTEGRAQLVLMTGEAGIGKTRLVEELRTRCAEHGGAAAEARCYPVEGVLAYEPVATWLRSNALEAGVASLDRSSQVEVSRLVPELGDRVPGLHRPEPLPESEQRGRLFAALARVLSGGVPGGAPLLLVLDDIHWCDAETLRFLHYLLRSEPDAALLVAATARREELDDAHPLHELVAALEVMERYTEIELQRLTREETAALGERLVGRTLDPSDAKRLHTESEGNPLFAVEAVRAGWDGRRLQAGGTSPRVKALIRSRLARLSRPARELAGLAATLGRAFTTEVLAHAGGTGGEALLKPMEELWHARIIREHGPHSYDFSHDKVRAAAYESLSPARRRHNHLAVARALERLHAGDVAAVSGLIATHYESAGATEQAIPWYERAAEAARRLHANAEAARLLRRALALLGTPHSVEGQARELALLTSLLAPLAATEAWASRELADAQHRALDLVRSLRVEPPPQLLRSLAFVNLSAGEFDQARRFGEQLHVRARRDGDDALSVEGDYVLGVAAFWQGAFADARARFEAAVARYSPRQRTTHLVRYGLDPQAVCLGRLGNTLCYLGRLGEARRARMEALELAEAIGHPQTCTTVLVFAALLSLELRDAEGLREDVRRLLAWREADESQHVRLAAAALEGCLALLDGGPAEGLAQVRRARDEARRAEHAPGLSAVISRLLLEACAAAGDLRGAVAACESALAPDVRARIFEAELRRRRAECLATLGRPAAEVEGELAEAMAVARRHGAALFELRAAASLVRHHERHRNPAAAGLAREALATVVAALPEAPDPRELPDRVTLGARI